MKKVTFYIVTTVYIAFNPLLAKEVDCRNLSQSTSECDTYGVKLLYNVKPVKYQNRKKVITSKTLPVPQKKKLKVITVKKLIEKHIKVNEPIRFSDTYSAKNIKYIETNITKTAKSKVKKETKIPTEEERQAKKKSIAKKSKDKLVDLIENWDKDKKSVYVKKEKKKPKAVAKPKSTKYKFLQRNYNRKLRVLATAYTSHRNQTDNTPFLAAWNNRIRPGMKIIAVSPDLIRQYGLRNGSKVRISGLKGTYVVRDKMNKRFRKKIDIYMGTDKRRAMRWGRRYVTLYW